MRIRALFLLACLLAGCATPQSTDSDRALSGTKARAWLDQHLASADTVQFISHNGISYGKEGDTTITFKKAGRAEVTVLGYGPVTYAGPYSVDRTGAIRISLEDYAGKWPDMLLFPDTGDAARLFPANGDTGFGPGSSGVSVMNSSWPYRYQGN